MCIRDSISASLTGRVMTPLEARNGIYVRLRGAVDLHDGDYILLGKQVLMFELVAEPERNVRPAIEHGVVVFGTPVRPPWARLRQITPAAVTRDIYHLTLSLIHISEPTRLLSISYAVFCLKK